MSVPTNRRSESKLEVIVNAKVIQDRVIDLRQRNLGIKRINNKITRYYDYGVYAADRVERCRELINDFKISIFNTSEQLRENLDSANSITPISLVEYETRRMFQNLAIANCKSLKTKLQEIIDTFNLDINMYRQITIDIDREIDLIKRWRQSDNRFKLRIKSVI